MSESSLIKFAKIMIITLVTNSHGKKKKRKKFSAFDWSLSFLPVDEVVMIKKIVII